MILLLLANIVVNQLLQFLQLMIPYFKHHEQGFHYVTLLILFTGHAFLCPVVYCVLILTLI